MAEISLTEGNQNMLVMSSLKGMKELTDGIETCDNIVLMKAGSSMDRIVPMLEAEGLLEKRWCSVMWVWKMNMSARPKPAETMVTLQH